MKILLTGAAGFIGMHTAQALCLAGHQVVGLDNLNDYYPVSLKQARLAQLHSQAGFRFVRGDIADAPALLALFRHEAFDAVIHLAAQAGVRHSLVAPQAYVQSNLVGMANVLEACRQHPVRHLLYASSSSVYGNAQAPFSEQTRTDQPQSFYAATKKAGEAMAYSYAQLYGLPCSGLRLFTVYGPWGRPDMAPWLFTEALLAGRDLTVYNHGQSQRDFSYIDDIVRAMLAILPLAPSGPGAPHRLLNLGQQQAVPLLQFIQALETLTGRTAHKRYLDLQAGDVHATCADTSALQALIGPQSLTPLSTGLGHFVDWFRQYHGHPH